MGNFKDFNYSYLFYQGITFNLFPERYIFLRHIYCVPAYKNQKELSANFDNTTGLEEPVVV